MKQCVQVTSHFLETLSLVAMLAIFAIICLYGMQASLVNAIFSKTLIPVGPSLIKVLYFNNDDKVLVKFNYDIHSWLDKTLQLINICFFQRTRKRRSLRPHIHVSLPSLGKPADSSRLQNCWKTMECVVSLQIQSMHWLLHARTPVQLRRSTVSKYMPTQTL